MGSTASGQLSQLFTAVQYKSGHNETVAEENNGPKGFLTILCFIHFIRYVFKHTVLHMLYFRNGKQAKRLTITGIKLRRKKLEEKFKLKCLRYSKFKSVFGNVYCW